MSVRTAGLVQYWKLDYITLRIYIYSTWLLLSKGLIAQIIKLYICYCSYMFI